MSESNSNADRVIVQIDQQGGYAIVAPGFMPTYELSISSVLGHREAAARAMVRMAQEWIERAQTLQRGELELIITLMADPASPIPEPTEPEPDPSNKLS